MTSRMRSEDVDDLVLRQFHDNKRHYHSREPDAPPLTFWRRLDESVKDSLLITPKHYEQLGISLPFDAQVIPYPKAEALLRGVGNAPPGVEVFGAHSQLLRQATQESNKFHRELFETEDSGNDKLDPSRDTADHVSSPDSDPAQLANAWDDVAVSSVRGILTAAKALGEHRMRDRQSFKPPKTRSDIRKRDIKALYSAIDATKLISADGHHYHVSQENTRKGLERLDEWLKMTEDESPDTEFLDATKGLFEPVNTIFCRIVDVDDPKGPTRSVLAPAIFVHHVLGLPGERLSSSSMGENFPRFVTSRERALPGTLELENFTRATKASNLDVPSRCLEDFAEYLGTVKPESVQASARDLKLFDDHIEAVISWGGNLVTGVAQTTKKHLKAIENLNKAEWSESQMADFKAISTNVIRLTQADIHNISKSLVSIQKWHRDAKSMQGKYSLAELQRRVATTADTAAQAEVSCQSQLSLVPTETTEHTLSQLASKKPDPPLKAVPKHRVSTQESLPATDETRITAVESNAEGSVAVLEEESKSEALTKSQQQKDTDREKRESDIAKALKQMRETEISQRKSEAVNRRKLNQHAAKTRIEREELATQTQREREEMRRYAKWYISRQESLGPTMAANRCMNPLDLSSITLEDPESLQARKGDQPVRTFVFRASEFPSLPSQSVAQAQDDAEAARQGSRHETSEQTLDKSTIDELIDSGTSTALERAIQGESWDAELMLGSGEQEEASSSVRRGSM